MYVDINSGIFKNFSQNSKNNLISNSTKNYLKVNSNVPKELYSNSSNTKLITSQKESSKLQSDIDKFQNLIKNVNSSVGFTEIVANTISNQSELLNLIKNKSNEMINGSSQVTKKEIDDLIYKMDYFAKSAQYNGKSLLTGEFKNQSFMHGMDSNQQLNVSLNSTKSSDLGKLKYETTQIIKENGNISIEIVNRDKSIKFDNVKMGYSKGEGLGSLTNLINEQSDFTGINASYNVTSTGFKAIESGRVENLKINGVSIGSLDVKSYDSDNLLTTKINTFTSTTGVSAKVDESGRLNLTSIDGRGIKVEADNGLSTVTNIHENSPAEVKFEANYNYTDSLISSGFKINGITINDSAVSVNEFINLANSKYDESGVKLEAINGKIKFTSKNVDNMKDVNINLDFKSTNDAYSLGLISTDIPEWRVQDVASGTEVDLNIASGNIFRVNDIEINLDNLSLSERVAQINSKSAETGVNAEELASGRVKLTSLDSKMINLYLADTSNNQDLGLGDSFSTLNDISEVYMKSGDKITLKDVGVLKNFGISSKDDIDSFVNIVDGLTSVWTKDDPIVIGYMGVNELVDTINSKSDLTGITASFDSVSKELKLDTIDNRDFKISTKFMDNGSVSLMNFEDEESIKNQDIEKILNSYSQTTDSFNYNLDAQNVYYEGFENYGKFTINTKGSSDINVDVRGSYLFRNASINSTNTTVNLKNLETGFSINEAEALGLFANDNFKSNYSRVGVEELSKDVIGTILTVVNEDFNNINSNLNTIDDNLQSGIDTIKEFVSDLRNKNENIKDAMEITKEVYKKDALIPTIGNEYAYKAKLDFETKFMKLLLL